MNQERPQVPSPNLLPQSRITARSREGAVRFWAFSMAALVILIAIPSALMSIQLRTSKPVDNQHFTRFVNDLDQLHAAIPPLKQELTQLQSASKSIELAKTRIQWTSVLGHLNSITDQSVRIHAFNASINTAGPTQSIDITIEIRTKSLTKAREYLIVIESAGLFDTVEMIESRRLSSREDSPVNSMIRGRIIAAQPAGETP